MSKLTSDISKIINKNKTKIIIVLVLWIIVAIVFVAPVSIGIIDATGTRGFSLTKLLESLMKNIASPITSIELALTDKYIGCFWGTLGYFTLIYLAFGIFGIYKMRSKSNYEDIEHGSSDWCEAGEQYEMLDSRKGIILAEKNYLPVDKRGNVNVLVVGRFGFW